MAKLVQLTKYNDAPITINTTAIESIEPFETTASMIQMINREERIKLKHSYYELLVLLGVDALPSNGTTSPHQNNDLEVTS